MTTIMIIIAALVGGAWGWRRWSRPVYYEPDLVVDDIEVNCDSCNDGSPGDNSGGRDD